MELNGISNLSVVNAEQNAHKQEPKPNLKSENDTVELSNKKDNTAKKIALGAAICTLASSAAALALMIGRNPAKAAKVLKGTSEVLENSFNEGRQLMNKVLAKEGKFATSFDDVLSIFKQSDKKSLMHETLESVSGIINKQENKAPDKVKEAYTALKRNLDAFHKKLEQDLVQGKRIENGINEKFVNENLGHSTTIKNYLDDLALNNEVNTEQYMEILQLKDRFSKHSMEFYIAPSRSITECPKDLLPVDGIFFHGTMKPKNIYDKGLSPYASRQIDKSARELGAGVYITPDVNVAANFSGLNGSIIPVKVGADSKIALVTEDLHSTLSEKINSFLGERFTKEEWAAISDLNKHTLLESLFNKAFKEAGYDAAYMPKSFKSGGGLLGGLFTPDVNQVFGRNQSQLVVFTPEKLEIVSRSFKERVLDLKAKFNALQAQLKYQKEHPFGF